MFQIAPVSADGIACDGHSDFHVSAAALCLARTASSSGARHVAEDCVDMCRSISLPHLQFISFSFLLPFGWPSFVTELASYVASMVSFDFG
jgi:hypothetical protein